MSDWRFRRRQGWCNACEARFAEGDRHVSVLRIAGEELRREDTCLPCWTARPMGIVRLPDSPDWVGDDLFYWFTRHHEGRCGLHLDLATLEQLFLRLEDRPEPRVREMRYVLCLLLMRKRRLKLDRVLRGPDGESLTVHRPRRKESLSVFVFDFKPERIQALRTELMSLLEGAEPASSFEPPGEALEVAGDSPSEGTEVTQLNMVMPIAETR